RPAALPGAGDARGERGVDRGRAQQRPGRIGVAEVGEAVLERAAGQVEEVVGELEGDAEVEAGAPEALLGVDFAREQRRAAPAPGEQRAGLPLDDLAPARLAE